MLAYHTNIVEKTKENKISRSVLLTTPLSKLEVMSLDPGQEINLETHPDTDQFIKIEEGCGTADLDGEQCELKNGVAIIIPADTKSNIMNTSSTNPLKLFSLVTRQSSKDTKLDIVDQIHFAHW